MTSTVGNAPQLSWWDRWGKKVAAVACATAAVVVTPINPVVGVVLGGACGIAFGADPHVQALGASLGAGIVGVMDAVRGKKK